MRFPLFTLRTLLCSALLSTTALAVQIDIGGDLYEVTLLETSFDANSVLLMDQPWWGNQALAESVVAEIGGSLGFPNMSSRGALAAYEIGPLNVAGEAKIWSVAIKEYDPTVARTGSWENVVRSYAVAELVPGTFSLHHNLPDGGSSMVLLGLSLIGLRGLHKRAARRGISA